MRETSHAENPRMRRAPSYPVDLSRMSAMEVAVATAPPEERDDFEAIAGVVGLLALKNKSPTPEEDYPAPMLPDDDEMESEEEEAPPPRPAPPPEGFFWQASPKQDGSMAGSSYVDGTFTLYLSALLEQSAARRLLGRAAPAPVVVGGERVAQNALELGVVLVSLVCNHLDPLEHGDGYGRRLALVGDALYDLIDNLVGSHPSVAAENPAAQIEHHLVVDLGLKRGEWRRRGWR